MEWNRSETIALSAEKCACCRGLGTREARKGLEPCGCVLRSVFRACYERFRECANKDLDLSRVSLEHGVSHDSAAGWGRVNEEYVADFLNVVRRTLDDDDYRLFRYHHVLGADWHLCCRKLGMEKGPFFHAIYRMRERLGRAFRELQPYPLYPLSEYFSPGFRSAPAQKVVPINLGRNKLRDRVPLKSKAA